MVSGHVLVSPFNVATRFGCFPAGVLSVPTLHDARGSGLTVRFRGDLESACVFFVPVCAATTTERPACSSDPPTGRVLADHLAHSVPSSSSPKKDLSFPTTHVDVDNDNAVFLYIADFQSHSHYLDPGRDITGRRVDVTWSLLPT